MYTNEEFRQKLGESLKAERESRGIKAIEISKKMGVNKSTISYYESGAKNMSAAALRDYCECLGISMSDFFAKYFD